MDGYCSNCGDWGEVFTVRILGLGLRHFDEKCIRWAHEALMDIQLVPDADQRRHVEGRREVWTAAVRAALTGKAVA